MRSLEWIPRFDRPLIKDDRKLGCVTIDKTMKDHSEMSANFLKPQKERLFLKPHQAAQLVHPIPEDDRAASSPQQCRDKRVFRKFVRNKGYPASCSNDIDVQRKGVDCAARFGDHRDAAALRK